MDTYEYVLLGIDSAIVSLLYYFYRKKTQSLRNVEIAPQIEMDKSILDTLPPVNDYVCINGRVEPIGREILSNYNKNRGVIRVIEIKEHGLKYGNSITSDTTKTLSKMANAEPFNLFNKITKTRVQVDQPLKAEFIMSELENTYKIFEPSTESFASKLFTSLLSNEITKGIETTEEMLKRGTMLHCYGKLERLSDDTYRITAPLNSGFRYILTKQTPEELKDTLRSTKTALKVALIIFGSIGASYGVYLLYKYLSKYIEHRQRQLFAERVRQERVDAQRNRNIGRQQNNEMNDPNSTCVSCLVNPREIILLDCGHVCICVDCLEMLPEPNCPICRQHFHSTARCYIP